MRFDGPAYFPKEDDRRLIPQHERIKALMLDGAWRTISEIEAVTGDPANSVSAQLRHLRKPRFGSFVVERRSRGERETGLFEYRVTSPEAYRASYGKDPAPRPSTKEMRRALLEFCAFASSRSTSAELNKLLMWIASLCDPRR